MATHKRESAYIELNSEQLIAFSDLHGNFANVDLHIELLCESLKGARVVFLGDAIDYWYPPHLRGDKDPDAQFLLNECGGYLKNFEKNWPGSASRDVELVFEAVIQGKAYRELSIGSIRRAFLGAVFSYECLRTLHSIPDLTFLLGNHEVDLLSGAWFYRSLQKAFLLNILGVAGLWCLEYRDWKKGRDAIKHDDEMGNLREKLLVSSRSQAIFITEKYDPILNWLFTRPLALGNKNWLFMHGGPTMGLLSFLERQHSDFSGFFDSKLEETGFADALFRETTGAGDTFLAPKYDNYHFAQAPVLTRSWLNFFRKRFLCVGHSALIGAESWGDPISERIALLNGAVLKLDAGKKRHFHNGHHYAVFASDQVEAYRFRENQRTPTKYSP